MLRRYLLNTTMQLHIDHKVSDVSEALNFLANVTRQINMGHKSGLDWDLDGGEKTESDEESTPDMLDKTNTTEGHPEAPAAKEAEKPQEEAAKPQEAKQPEEKKGPDGKYPWEKKPKK